MDLLKGISVPFNKPSIVGSELEYVRASIASGHISGDGGFTKKCQTFFETNYPVKKALLTTSCTHALEMSALLVGIQPGDNVIMPSYTFVSTANAFVLRGAKPVFIDIRSDTLNINEQRIAERISPKTKAIVVVHYGGVACEMDDIMAISKKHEIPVIEDNAHGLFGRYYEQPLGTFGAMSAQSFHETKNIQCGEGGALFINDPLYIERAEILREKGTDRSKYCRGEIDKYSWVDTGSSYVPSDMLAAFLYGQLERWRAVQEKRQNIWYAYKTALSDWAFREGVRLPALPRQCDQRFHKVYLLLPNAHERGRFIDHMRNKGVLAIFHYVPLHLSTMGRTYGYMDGMLPVTEEVSARIVRLPMYYSMTESELSRVIDAVKEFHVPLDSVPYVRL